MAALVSVGYFMTQCVSAYAAETNFWSSRRRVVLGLQEQASLASGTPSLSQFQKVIPDLRPNVLSSVAIDRLSADVPEEILRKYTPILQAISPGYGTVRRIALPWTRHGEGKTVIFLQDIHKNDEAQAILGKIVESLIAPSHSKPASVSLVAMEAAFSPLNLDKFRNFENPEAVRMAADYSLKKHGITGPVHTAYTCKGPIPPFIGVDDPVHYQANIEAYRRSAPVQEEVRLRMAVQIHTLEQRKKTVFNKELLAFDQTIAAYHKGKTPFGDYVRALDRFGGTNSREIRAFIQALAMETSMDFPQVERERARLIKVIARQWSKAELDRLIETSVSYQEGGMTHFDFHKLFWDLCRRNGVDLAAYPFMDRYVRYVILAGRINPDKLFLEIGAAEKDIYGRLARTQDEKWLTKESRRLALSDKLLDFSLTPDEWAEYESVRPSGQFSSFETFYREAEIRNHAMTENILRVMGERNIQNAIFVGGGFHAEGMTRLLNNRGVTVIEVAPRLTKLDGTASSYLSVFTQEKSPLEKLFKGDRLFVGDLANKDGANETMAINAALAGAGLAGDANKALSYFGRLQERAGQMSDVKIRGPMVEALVTTLKGKVRATLTLDKTGAKPAILSTKEVGVVSALAAVGVFAVGVSHGVYAVAWSHVLLAYAGISGILFLMVRIVRELTNIPWSGNLATGGAARNNNLRSSGPSLTDVTLMASQGGGSGSAGEDPRVAQLINSFDREKFREWFANGGETVHAEQLFEFLNQIRKKSNYWRITEKLVGPDPMVTPDELGEAYLPLVVEDLFSFNSSPASNVPADRAKEVAQGLLEKYKSENPKKTGNFENIIHAIVGLRMSDDDKLFYFNSLVKEAPQIHITVYGAPVLIGLLVNSGRENLHLAKVAINQLLSQSTDSLVRVSALKALVMLGLFTPINRSREWAPPPDPPKLGGNLVPNTSEEYRRDWILRRNPNAIINQEIVGQTALVESGSVLPIKGKNNEDQRALLARLGVQVLEPVVGDDLFWNVNLPEGWRLVPDDQSNSATYLVGTDLKIQATIIYYAAFYKRDAHIIIHDQPKTIIPSSGHLNFHEGENLDDLLKRHKKLQLLNKTQMDSFVFCVLDGNEAKEVDLDYTAGQGGATVVFVRRDAPHSTNGTSLLNGLVGIGLPGSTLGTGTMNDLSWARLSEAGGPLWGHVSNWNATEVLFFITAAGFVIWSGRLLAPTVRNFFGKVMDAVGGVFHRILNARQAALALAALISVPVDGQPANVEEWAKKIETLNPRAVPVGMDTFLKTLRQNGKPDGPDLLEELNHWAYRTNPIFRWELARALKKDISSTSTLARLFLFFLRNKSSVRPALGTIVREFGNSCRDIVIGLVRPLGQKHLAVAFAVAGLWLAGWDSPLLIKDSFDLAAGLSLGWFMTLPPLSQTMNDNSTGQSIPRLPSVTRLPIERPSQSGGWIDSIELGRYEVVLGNDRFLVIHRRVNPDQFSYSTRPFEELRVDRLFRNGEEINIAAVNNGSLEFQSKKVGKKIESIEIEMMHGILKNNNQAPFRAGFVLMTVLLKEIAGQGVPVVEILGLTNREKLLHQILSARKESRRFRFDDLSDVPVFGLPECLYSLAISKEGIPRFTAVWTGVPGSKSQPMEGFNPEDEINFHKFLPPTIGDHFSPDVERLGRVFPEIANIGPEESLAPILKRLDKQAQSYTKAIEEAGENAKSNGWKPLSDRWAYVADTSRPHTIRLNTSNPFGSEMENPIFKVPRGWVVVHIHGSPNQFYRRGYVASGGVNQKAISPQVLAEEIQALIDSGDLPDNTSPILLLSCSTGRGSDEINPAPAQELAQRLGRPVVAPTENITHRIYSFNPVPILFRETEGPPNWLGAAMEIRAEPAGEWKAFFPHLPEDEHSTSSNSLLTLERAERNRAISQHTHGTNSVLYLAAGYDLTNVITTFPAATSVTMVGLFYNRVLDVQAIRRAMTDPNLKLVTKDYLESVQTQGYAHYFSFRDLSLESSIIALELLSLGVSPDTIEQAKDGNGIVFGRPGPRGTQIQTTVHFVGATLGSKEGSSQWDPIQIGNSKFDGVYLKARYPLQGSLDKIIGQISENLSDHPTLVVNVDSSNNVSREVELGGFQVERTHGPFYSEMDDAYGNSFLVYKCRRPSRISDDDNAQGAVVNALRNSLPPGSNASDDLLKTIHGRFQLSTLSPSDRSNLKTAFKAIKKPGLFSRTAEQLGRELANQLEPKSAVTMNFVDLSRWEKSEKEVAFRLLRGLLMSDRPVFALGESSDIFKTLDIPSEKWIRMTFVPGSMETKMTVVEESARKKGIVLSPIVFASDAGARIVNGNSRYTVETYGSIARSIRRAIDAVVALLQAA